MSDLFWPFGSLQVGAYQMIMADPPWYYRNFSAKGERKNPVAHYACMDIKSIASLPVGDLADKDAVLWLWATNPMLDQQIEVMKRWGFAFKTAGTWVKTTSRGKISFGSGYILRSSNEPFLIGTRGKPKTTKSTRTVIMALRREHSRKPDEAYRAAEALMPDARRADLFSRQFRTGWEAWGNETGKFGDDR